MEDGGGVFNGRRLRQGHNSRAKADMADYVHQPQGERAQDSGSPTEGGGPGRDGNRSQQFQSVHRNADVGGPRRT
eukprot:15221007-Alexandrium_andersonii.AAC.1